ncbi:PspA/IM30 family protein [Actinophytocola xanthii]|uniref:Uncharacterized protein n=1 Tax=Actinophytocola xanthii TaxID=1912961 RepID=A0A1Q8CMV7_9PSEU|nr:hypothetical protein [Actinophytocola xanthii]OLF15693.1 hypothetical protein BU204_19920 [Actinophytocola xanthii]
MVSYRGLEFDPTPGRLDAVTDTITQLTAAADALAAVEPALVDAARHAGGWRGAAAEAFRERLAATPGELGRRERLLREAVTALERWARTLARNQRHTEELDARALSLRARLRAAQDDLQDTQDAVDLAATPVGVAGASMALSGARDRVAELESALSEVLAEARELEREHLRASAAVADELAALRGEEPSTRPAASPAVRALAGVLGTASATSATLAGALTGPGRREASVPEGAHSAFAAALSSGRQTTGELVVRGETPLPRGEGG